MPLPDRDSAASYGALGKVDYQGLPPADPTISWSNPLIAPAFANVAGATAVIPRAFLSVTLNPTDGYMTLLNWGAVWQNATGTPPLLHHVSTGVYTFTFPALVSDEYNQSIGIVNNHTLNFRNGWGNIDNPGSLYSVSVSALANVLTVSLYNGSGLNDFSGKNLTIWGGF